MAPKVSEQHRIDRRHELLDSALRCFSERGYEATKVDDIVRFAGVSKGMLYTYFASKEDIFVALVNQRSSQFVDNMTKRFQTMASAKEKLGYLLVQYRDHPLKTEDRKWISVYLEFWLSASRDEQRHAFMQGRFQSFLEMFADIVTEGKASGEFDLDVNPDLASKLYWALCDGIHLHLSQSADATGEDEVWRGAAEMLFHYLKKEGNVHV